MQLSIILPVLVFVIILFFFFYLYRIDNARQKQLWIEKRLLNSSSKKTGPVDLLKTVFIKVGNFAKPKKAEALFKIKNDLQHAAYREEDDIAIFYGIRVLLPIILCILFIIILKITDKQISENLLVMIFPFAIGYFFPVYFLNSIIKNRNRKIFKELPDMIDLLIICVEAGLGFEAALLRISRELEKTAPILSLEFGRYFLETQSGLPRTQALMNIKQKNSEEGLAGFIDVLHQSITFGTNIAAALRVHSKEMRTKRRQVAEEKGAKVAAKLTLPLITLILPVLLIIILGPAAIKLYYRMQGVFF